MSEVIQGDCLEVLADFPDGEFDLIYVDPPFFTGRDWGEFDDRWESLDQYVEWVKVRAEQWHRVLKPTGSFYLHCDDTANAYLRLVCDVIFGRKNFKNEIIWKRTAGKSNSKKFGRVHDTILYYAGKGATWNTQYLPHRQVEDIFSDIKRLESQSREKVGYPTQKPVALLERLIRASTNAGDSVLDPMCGSGTTLLAARKLGRNYVGIDANPKAVQLAKARLAPPAQVEIGLYQGAG